MVALNEWYYTYIRTYCTCMQGTSLENSDIQCILFMDMADQLHFLPALLELLSVGSATYDPYSPMEHNLLIKPHV